MGIRVELSPYRSTESAPLIDTRWAFRLIAVGSFTAATSRNATDDTADALPAEARWHLGVDENEAPAVAVVHQVRRQPVLVEGETTVGGVIDDRSRVSVSHHRST